MHIIVLFTFIVISSQLSQAQGQGYCDAVICLPNQFCDTDRCTWQYSLGESCRGRGQCLQANSDCMDDDSGSMTCQCNPNFVQSKDRCVQGCSADAECNIFSRGSFCHAQLKGCLDQVDLNQGCDATAGDSQCKTEKASCSEDKCQCGPVFAEKNGICIDRCTSDNGVCPALQYCENDSGLCRAKSSLGGSCTTEDQCLPSGSECGGDICKCSTGLIEYYGSCLPSCTMGTGSCGPGQYCALPNNILGNICLPQVGLHQQCSRTDDIACLDADADCIAQAGPNLSATCECKSTYVEKDGSCLKACDPTEDCQSNGEFCNAETSLCELKRGLGDTCFTPGNDRECSGANAICGSASGDTSNLRCTCSEGYLEVVGACVAKCTSTATDCSQPGHYCHTGLGVCSPKIEINGLCNPTGDEDQCKTELTKCKPETSTCSCEGDLIEDLPSLSCVTKCEVSNDCGDMEKYCDVTTGGCLSRIPLNRDCLGEFEDVCLTSDAECSLVEDKNATICTCKGGFIERGDSCVAKCTGSPDSPTVCNSNEFCNTEGGICQSKVGLGNGCAADDQCSSSSSECSGGEGDKRCRCKDDYVQWVNTCIGRCDVGVVQCDQRQYCDSASGLCNQKKLLNRDCSESIECLNNNAVCQETQNRKICTCDTANGYLEDRALCIANCTREAVCDSNLEFCAASSGKCANRQPIHSSCTSYGSAEQCLGTFVTCKDEGECSCEDIAVESTDARRCLKLAEKLGEECEEGQQCLPLDIGGQNFTDCVSDLCGCKPDKAILSMDTTKCLKLAMTLGEECEEPQQCTPVGGGNAAITDCQTGECACKLEVAIESSDSKRCLKLAEALGEQCEEPRQCIPIGGGNAAITDCQTGECACKADVAVESADSKRCLKLAMTLGEECEEPQQCTPVGGGNAAITVCQTGECACKLEVAIESSDSKRCLKLANALGEQCEDPAQCFSLGNEGKNTTDCASNSQCACTTTSIQSEGRCYVQKLLGTTCSTDKECSVGITGSVECDNTSKTCSCTAGYTIQEDKKACIAGKNGAATVVFSIFTVLLSLLLTIC